MHLRMKKGQRAKMGPDFFITLVGGSYGHQVFEFEGKDGAKHQGELPDVHEEMKRRGFEVPDDEDDDLENSSASDSLAEQARKLRDDLL